MVRLISLIVLALLKSAAAFGEVPQRVTICQLQSDPSAYNHKLLAVTGFVSHGFEDFTLFDPRCSSPHNIWLEYGGLISSGTVYCCPGSPERRRPKNLIVEDISIPLTGDKLFRAQGRAGDAGGDDQTSRRSWGASFQQTRNPATDILVFLVDCDSADPGC
jgi:hypothetical protein